MEQKSFTVPNIGCDNCVRTIKNEVSEIEGVSSVDGITETKEVTIMWDNPASWDIIVEKLEEIEYPPAK